MFKKTITVCLALLLALSLTACGHEHQWTAAGCVSPATCSGCGETEGAALGHSLTGADCVSPATCSRCGGTEGAALGHSWTEATYQSPRTCSRCGAAEGEPLTAYYAAHGLEPRLLDMSGEYELTVPCGSDSTKSTTAKVTVESYVTFDSDETHEALEGYEWKILTLRVRFSDENAQRYGVGGFMRLSSDYYESDGATEAAPDGEYVTGELTWKGRDYPACAMSYGGGWSQWLQDENGGYYIENICVFTYRLPAGYDGAIAGVADPYMTVEPGTHMHENINDSTLLFRLN